MNKTWIVHTHTHTQMETNIHIYEYLYIHTKIRKSNQKKIITGKFHNTLPHTHTHTHTKAQYTRTHIHREEITVSEIWNHSNTLTHSHTQLTRVKRQKHIKYQRPIRCKQTKVDTLREMKERSDLYINL